MAAFDGAYYFGPTQGCFRGSQKPEALAVTEQPLHGSVIALDQVVAPLSIDMPNAVEVRVIPMIDLMYDTSIDGCFFSIDSDWAMSPHAFNRFYEKGFRRLRIAPCSSHRYRVSTASNGRAEVDHLAIRVDDAPKVSPFAANTKEGFVYYPASDHNVTCRECTCQSTLARRKCFSGRLVSSELNFYTQRKMVYLSTGIPRSARRSATFL